MKPEPKNENIDYTRKMHAIKDYHIQKYFVADRAVGDVSLTGLRDNIYQHREIIKTFAIISGTIAAFTLLLFTSPAVQAKGCLVAAVFFLLLTIATGLIKLKNRNERDNKGLADLQNRYTEIRALRIDTANKIDELIQTSPDSEGHERAIQISDATRIKVISLAPKGQDEPADYTLDILLWTFLPALVLIFLAIASPYLNDKNFLFIIPAAFVIMCLVALDKIIRIEYRKYKDRWIADKKPCGCFWKPKEISWFPSSIARNLLAFKWLFKTPQWIRKDVDAYLYLRLLRLFWILFIISIIAVDYIVSH